MIGVVYCWTPFEPVTLHEQANSTPLILEWRPGWPRNDEMSACNLEGEKKMLRAKREVAHW